MRRFIPFLITMLATGCTTYGTVVNQPLMSETSAESLYSLSNKVAAGDFGEATIVIAMSGGGTRAAALSYGVLKGLKEQKVILDGVEQNLLQEVDMISSVSGGSFTAAYYGLYGDKLFTDFEQDFLYYEFADSLFWEMMTPGHWLSSYGRTDEAIEYYQQSLFGQATFGDLEQENRPLIVINATDLVQGAKFSFTQEYFSLLCSDISTYPVANAVAASSAVPVVFNPVVLQNYAGCEEQSLLNLDSSDHYDDADYSVVAELKSYADKSEREYIHLVDGGVTDNLGLLAIHDIMSFSYFSQAEHLRPKISSKLIAILVDASASPSSEMNHSTKEPSISETVSFMSDAQVHRLNEISKARFIEDFQEFSDQKGKQFYFIDVNLTDITDSELRGFLNNVPTGFELSAEQVDALIDQGRTQVMSNQEMQRFLTGTN